MFRLLIAALCLSAASAYNGAAPVGKTTVFTGSKNSNIYRTATPSPLAAPAQVRSPVVYMSGAEEVVQYELFDPIKLAVWIVPSPDSPVISRLDMCGGSRSGAPPLIWRLGLDVCGDKSLVPPMIVRLVVCAVSPPEPPMIVRLDVLGGTPLSSLVLLPRNY